MNKRCYRAGLLALLAVGCAALPEPAYSEQASMPFVGRWRWSGPETCAKDFSGEGIAMEITRDRRLVFYESRCSVTSMRRLEKNSYRFRLTCRGEGEVNRTETMLVLMEKSAVSEELLLRIELNTGFVIAYRKCEGT
jgi:hypothetical protein